MNACVGARRVVKVQHACVHECVRACVRLLACMCVGGCANLVTQQGFLRESRLGTVSGPGQLLTSTAQNSN